MIDTREELFSIAVFPYLKTSGAVQFGPYLFRSTDDLEGLSEAQTTAVTDATAMLYTQNNARVRSASYAVIPQIHVSGLFHIPEVLRRVHTIRECCSNRCNIRHDAGQAINFETAIAVVTTQGRLHIPKWVCP
jgi:L-alanine-DL-glutamate epimerase-like enolase superfamily enzyme